MIISQGYTFDAETNGHSFKVTVPIGGVEEGQRFSVPFPATSNDFSGQAVPRASIPVGHWKDGLCDCCRLGCVHPVIWNAMCCSLSKFIIMCILCIMFAYLVYMFEHILCINMYGNPAHSIISSPHINSTCWPNYAQIET